MKTHIRLISALSATAIAATGIVGLTSARVQAANSDYEVKIGEATSHTQTLTAGDNPPKITATNPRKYETRVYAAQIFDASSESGVSEIGEVHLKGYRRGQEEGYGFCIEPTVPTEPGAEFQATPLADYKKDPQVAKYLSIVKAVTTPDANDIDVARVNKEFEVNLNAYGIVWAAQYAIWHHADPDYQMNLFKIGRDLLYSQTNYDLQGKMQKAPKNTPTQGEQFGGKYVWFDIYYNKSQPALSEKQIADVYKLYNALDALPPTVLSSPVTPTETPQLNITDATASVNETGEGHVNFKFSAAGLTNPTYSVTVTKDGIPVEGVENEFSSEGDEVSAQVTIPADKLGANGLDELAVTAQVKSVSPNATASGPVVLHPKAGGDITQSIITLGKPIDSTQELISSQTLTFAYLVAPEPALDPVVRTTVGVDGVKASAEAAVNITAEQAMRGVNVIDTVEYENLVPGTNYRIDGSLYEVKDETVVGEPLKTSSGVMNVEAANGTLDLGFGSVSNLEPGKSYVVFEKVTPVTDAEGSTEDPTRKGGLHEDPTAPSQTIIVAEKPALPEEPAQPTEEIPGQPTEDNPGQPTEETPQPETPSTEQPAEPGKEKPAEETPGGEEDKPGTPTEETPEQPTEEQPAPPTEESPGAEKPTNPGNETPNEEKPNADEPVIPGLDNPNPAGEQEKPSAEIPGKEQEKPTEPENELPQGEQSQDQPNPEQSHPTNPTGPQEQPVKPENDTPANEDPSKETPSGETTGPKEQPENSKPRESSPQEEKPAIKNETAQLAKSGPRGGLVGTLALLLAFSGITLMALRKRIR